MRRKVLLAGLTVLFVLLPIGSLYDDSPYSCQGHCRLFYIKGETDEQ